MALALVRFVIRQPGLSERLLRRESFADRESRVRPGLCLALQTAFSSDTRSSDCWSVAGECGDRVESWLWHVEMIGSECEVLFFESGAAVERVDRVVGLLIARGAVSVRGVERGDRRRFCRGCDDDRGECD